MGVEKEVRGAVWVRLAWASLRAVNCITSRRKRGWKKGRRGRLGWIHIALQIGENGVRKQVRLIVWILVGKGRVRP